MFKMFLRFFIVAYSLAFIGTVASCNKTPKECKDFQTGRFKYNNPSLSQWVVTRNDSLQIEQNIKNGAKVISKIDWQSNCKYTLRFLEEQGFPSNHKSDEAAIEIIEVEILEVSADSYKYQATGPKNSTISWMIKLGD